MWIVVSEKVWRFKIFQKIYILILYVSSWTQSRVINPSCLSYWNVETYNLLKWDMNDKSEMRWKLKEVLWSLQRNRWNVSAEYLFQAAGNHAVWSSMHSWFCTLLCLSYACPYECIYFEFIVSSGKILQRLAFIVKTFKYCL